MTVWHVATTGFDRARGSVDAPFRTISRTAAVAMAGDTVTVHEGVYREWVDTARGGTADAATACAVSHADARGTARPSGGATRGNTDAKPPLATPEPTPGRRGCAV